MSKRNFTAFPNSQGVRQYPAATNSYRQQVSNSVVNAASNAGSQNYYFQQQQHSQQQQQFPTHQQQHQLRQPRSSYNSTASCWHIKDEILPKPNNFDNFQLWPDGYQQLIYDAGSQEAAGHQSGWAMRNTNNHDSTRLKKSCLGVMLCSLSCRSAKNKKDLKSKELKEDDKALSSLSSSSSSSVSLHQTSSLLLLSSSSSSSCPALKSESPVVTKDLGTSSTSVSCNRSSKEVKVEPQCLVHARPFICDKARTKQRGQPCSTPGCKGVLVQMKCTGHAGKPVTHVWRSIGGVVYFQCKGVHDHPKPEPKSTAGGKKKQKPIQEEQASAPVKRRKRMIGLKSEGWCGIRKKARKSNAEAIEVSSTTVDCGLLNANGTTDGQSTSGTSEAASNRYSSSHAGQSSDPRFSQSFFTTSQQQQQLPQQQRRLPQQRFPAGYSEQQPLYKSHSYPYYKPPTTQQLYTTNIYINTEPVPHRQEFTPVSRKTEPVGPGIVGDVLLHNDYGYSSRGHYDSRFYDYYSAGYDYQLPSQEPSYTWPVQSAHRHSYFSTSSLSPVKTDRPWADDLCPVVQGRESGLGSMGSNFNEHDAIPAAIIKPYNCYPSEYFSDTDIGQLQSRPFADHAPLFAVDDYASPEQSSIGDDVEFKMSAIARSSQEENFGYMAQVSKANSRKDIYF